MKELIMTSDLLLQLEKKVAHAVEVIELLRLQVEELEQENGVLKSEHEKWRKDLTSLISRFDQIDSPKTAPVSHTTRMQTTQKVIQEEEFMTV
jgi:FtsZ-binding cell division protein ZapB